MTENEQTTATPEATIKKTENVALKKIQMLSNLASACDNPQLIAAFESLKNGNDLYTIFVEAVNAKIELLMNGEVQKVTKPITDIQSAAAVVLNQIGHMHQIMQALHNATLIQALGLLNKNLGGRELPAEANFELPPQTSNQTPPVQPPTPPAQPLASTPNYSNNVPASDRRRGGNTPGFF